MAPSRAIGMANSRVDRRLDGAENQRHSETWARTRRYPKRTARYTSARIALVPDLAEDRLQRSFRMRANSNPRNPLAVITDAQHAVHARHQHEAEPPVRIVSLVPEQHLVAVDWRTHTSPLAAWVTSALLRWLTLDGDHRRAVGLVAARQNHPIAVAGAGARAGAGRYTFTAPLLPPTTSACSPTRKLIAVMVTPSGKRPGALGQHRGIEIARIEPENLALRRGDVHRIARLVIATR
jgi:hypothetical protein